MQQLATGIALWCFDQEILDRNIYEGIAPHFSGGGPFHKHSGNIILCTSAIYLEGDEITKIPHSAIEQIFLGYDEVYTRSLVKNFGLFCQPLRINYEDNGNDHSIYLIIDYHFMGTSKNQAWFNAIKDLLSG